VSYIASRLWLRLLRLCDTQIKSIKQKQTKVSSLARRNGKKKIEPLFASAVIVSLLLRLGSHVLLVYKFGPIKVGAAIKTSPRLASPRSNYICGFAHSGGARVDDETTNGSLDLR
jgi:hypothetical protein